MICTDLLVIGEVGSGKTHYVRKLLETGVYSGYELIWAFNGNMPISLRDSYREQFTNFVEFTLCPISSVWDLKQLLASIKCSYDSDGYSRVVVFDDLQVNMPGFKDMITYFIYHVKSLNTSTIITVLAKYQWEELKSNCQAIVLFKLNNRRIIDRVVEHTFIQKNYLYSLYDNFVARGVHEHILVDLTK